MTPGHSSGVTFLSEACLYQIFKHPDQKKKYDLWYFNPESCHVSSHYEANNTLCILTT